MQQPPATTHNNATIKLLSRLNGVTYMTKLEGNILLASVHGQACITTYYLPLVILKEEKLPNSLTYPCLYVTFFPEMC